MSQQFQARRISAGQQFDHTPVADVAAGAVVIVGSVAGVAARPIAAGTLGALELEGIFDIVKVNGVIAAGSIVYWDADGDPQGGTAGSGAATTTSTSNTFLGYTIADAGATDETVRVHKFAPAGVTNTVHETLSAVITDPGDAGAIPVTASGSVSLVTADAETRTLADPTFVGQQLALALKTDGGDCVVTAASPVNQTGNNTLTFGDAGDALTLVAVEVGAELNWRVVANDGVGLSTV